MLVAVLTQQKYNDAAVSSSSGRQSRPTSRSSLSSTSASWPSTRSSGRSGSKRFAKQTVAAELAYVVPYDRSRPICACRSTRSPVAGSGGRAGQAVGRIGNPSYSSGSVVRASGPCRTESSFLIPHPSSFSRRPRFPPRRPGCACTSTRSRSARSAARCGRVLDAKHGLPAYLDTVRRAAGEFAAAHAALSATELGESVGRRCPPACWLTRSASGGTARGRRGPGRYTGFTGPWDAASPGPCGLPGARSAGPQVDPMPPFQQQERTAVVAAVQKLLEELDRLAKVGNDVLGPRLAAFGWARWATLLERVQAAHQTLPAIDEDYRAFLRAELDGLAEARIPGRCGSYRSKTKTEPRETT